MKQHQPDDIPEENVRQLIAVAGTEPMTGLPQERVAAILEEVRRQRGRLWVRRVAKVAFAVGAAAAAIILVVGIWDSPPVPPQKPGFDLAGKVEALYGFVSVSNGHSPRMLRQGGRIASGQWVQTHSGSRAEIVLADESRILVQPRTSMRIADRSNGQGLVLVSGILGIDAAKQTPGRSLTIQTPESWITVLGTKLEVHVVNKPDGTTQTRVSVTAGRVEIESAGERISLPANTEGIVDEGRPPIRRCLTAEVNAMLELIKQNDAMAAESGARAHRPVIVEFHGDGTAVVWTIVPIANETAQPLNRYSLECGLSASMIEAFSLEGTKLSVMPEGKSWGVDFSDSPLLPGEERSIIAKASGIEGIFQAKGAGTFQLHMPTANPPATGLCLLQVWLPGSAEVEDVSPAPIETRRKLSRLLLTLVSDEQLSPIIK